MISNHSEFIGKLIPAGTGMKRYRTTRLSTDAVETISFDEDGFGDEVLDFGESSDIEDIIAEDAPAAVDFAEEDDTFDAEGADEVEAVEETVDAE